MSRRGVVLFLAMSFVWGLPYLMIREAVRNGVDPGTLVFLRTAPAAVILLPIAWRRGVLAPVLARWRWVVVYAAVHFGVPWLLMSGAEQHLTSSVTGMLVASVPLAQLPRRARHPPRRPLRTRPARGPRDRRARRRLPRRLRRRRARRGCGSSPWASWSSATRSARSSSRCA